MTPLAVKSDIYLGAHCASKLGFNTTINNLVTPRQVNSSGKGKLACEPMARIIWDCMATISKMSRSVIRHWNAPMSYESLRPLCHVDQRFLRLFELLMNKFLKSEKKKMHKQASLFTSWDSKTLDINLKHRHRLRRSNPWFTHFGWYSIWDYIRSPLPF